MKNSSPSFCFQEWLDIDNPFDFSDLNNYKSVVAEKDIGNDEKLSVGSFIKKKFKVIGSATPAGERMNLGISLVTQIMLNEDSITIGNVHGLPEPGHKLDTKERIEQATALIEFFEKTKGLKTIGGDFNLLPDTESIKMFERHGYTNLIKKYKIKTTRNDLTWKLYPDNKQLYSDYVFVSPEIKVKSFEVLDIKISDHLPMVLEIED